MKNYQRVYDDLTAKGMEIVSFKPKAFGCDIEASHPFGSKKVQVSLSYSSFLRALSVELSFPYSPVDKELQQEYDRVFPEEVGAIGRSSPKFEQAIIDYMRGQSGTGNVVELRDYGREVHISLQKGCQAKKEDGFLEALGKVSFELRKGVLHEDVLTHLFAF